MDHDLTISKPRQAVILAGGRGLRLKPLTDTMPKPMLPFHGRPFLEYLIEHLKEQGFEKALLLLGYLPEGIMDHFGDGSSFGLHMEYSVTGAEDDTGKRLRLAAPKMDPYFLLMYSDNYWPMRINSMWDQFMKSGTDMQFTVYSNKDSYSRDNVRIRGGLVELYDGSRTNDNLQGVEIGFALTKKSILGHLPDTNVNFEKVVYPILAQKKRLSAYVTDHRYYSVGSHERLDLTRSFLARRPAVILDRDGVLNKKAPKAEYVRNSDEFEWLPGAMEALRLLKDAGYIVTVVTNQAGIARGMMTELDLSRIHQMMQDAVAKNGRTIDAVYYCPHGWDDGCECRKPRPGMLFQAQKEFNLDLSRVYFVGDDARDRETADRAGAKFLMVDDNNSLLHLVKERILKC